VTWDQGYVKEAQRPVRSLKLYLGVEPKIGGNTPKWMVKIMENPYLQMG